VKERGRVEPVRDASKVLFFVGGKIVAWGARVKNNIVESGELQ